MGIHDRQYAREGRGSYGGGSGGFGGGMGGGFGGGGFGGGVGGRGPKSWPFNTWLLIVNVAVFLVGVMTGLDPQIKGLFSFSTHFGFARLEVWRLVTFQFLHADFLHLFFNMFGLYIFGGMVEQYLGAKRYAAFYLMCGICGGLLYLILNGVGMLTNGALPGSLNVDAMTPLIGASAGVFGVIVAAARIAPDMQVMLIFPPVPLKLKWLAYGYVGIAAFNLIIGGSNAGGDAAHIGGAIAGFFFIRNAHLLRDFFDVFRNSNKPPKAARAKKSGVSEADVDRVLAKVRDKGIASLTEREKKLLEKASREKRAGA